MRTRAVVLAAVTFAAAMPTAAADHRFGVTVGLSGVGALDWTSGVGGCAWVRVLGPATIDVDFGRYIDDSVDSDYWGSDRWHGRYTMLSAGVGVRRRRGPAHWFGHVLLGTWKERTERTTYVTGLRPRTDIDLIEESETVMLIGGGIDVEIGPASLRLSIEMARGGGARINLAVGY